MESFFSLSLSVSSWNLFLLSLPLYLSIFGKNTQFTIQVEKAKRTWRESRGFTFNVCHFNLSIVSSISLDVFFLLFYSFSLSLFSFFATFTLFSVFLSHKKTQELSFSNDGMKTHPSNFWNFWRAERDRERKKEEERKKDSDREDFFYFSDKLFVICIQIICIQNNYYAQSLINTVLFLSFFTFFLSLSLFFFSLRFLSIEKNILEWETDT